jgi:hypothetical protein
MSPSLGITYSVGPDRVKSLSPSVGPNIVSLCLRQLGPIDLVSVSVSWAQ